MSDKQDLNDKIVAYVDLIDKLEDLDSSLSDVDHTMRGITATEPRACDFSSLLQSVGDELAVLLEAVRARSSELEDLLDDMD